MPAGDVRKGAALEVTEAVLGGPLVEIDTLVSVALSPTVTKLVNGNGDRVGLIVINTGSNDALITPDTTVSSTRGIRIGANGGSAVTLVRDDFTLPSREWNSTSLVGATTLYIIELIRFTAERAAVAI